MALFSKRQDHEPSYSREWFSRNGLMARKSVLALAVVKRLTEAAVGEAVAWGRPLDGAPFEEARTVVDLVVVQDGSLARAVARDVALLFESLGGLTVNRTAALESVALDDSFLVTDGSPRTTQTDRAAADALAVARTIQARSQNGEGLPQDVAVYTALYEDVSTGGHDRALDIGAWAGTVAARLGTSGRIAADIPVFAPHASLIPEMHSVGWYPNPINAGDTSAGDAQIERWWDGNDWTDRVRTRDGKRWSEQRTSLLTAPTN